MRPRLAALAFIGFVPSGLPPPALALDRPNIVLFLADDMGWADWEHDGGAFGSTYYETPNINRLSREGVTFANAHASSSTCSPTRHALMTGLSPARSRMTSWLPGSTTPAGLADPRWVRELADAHVTLPEALAAAGYRTALVGKWHLGMIGSSSADPLQHGFEVNFGGGPEGTPPTWFANRWGSFRLTNMGDGTATEGDYLTDELTDLALEQIESFAQEDDPFFLFLSHHAPHVPIRAPDALVGKYAAKPPSAEHDDPVYAAMLESLDTSLGRVLDALEQRGLRANTIVVFTSDNGGSDDITSNAPLRAGKGRLYEGGTRVPLIVSWTGNAALEPGSTRSSLAISHDLYPTLLHLSDTPGDPVHDARVDGQSLRWVLEQGDSLEGPIFWHQPHIPPEPLGGRGGRYLSAVRDGDWKALYFYEDSSWELYDLSADPHETVNVVWTNREIADRLSLELVYWLYGIRAQLPIDEATGRAVPLPVPLPEPAGALLLAVGAAALRGLARRRSH